MPVMPINEVTVIPDKPLEEPEQHVLELFKGQVALCNKQHLLVCDCQKDKVEEIEELYEEQLQKQIEEEGLHEDSYIVDSRRSNNRKKSIEHVAGKLENTGKRCPVEKQLVVDIIKHFDEEQEGMYDLRRTDVKLILRSLISQLLSAHRMQLYSDHHGVVQEVYDKDGNRHLTMNPVEEAKLKFDKAVVSAVEKLNNIVYGTKNLNLNVDTDGETLADIMDKIRSNRVKKDR